MNNNILPFRTKEQGLELSQKLKERRELEQTMKTCFGMPTGEVDPTRAETDVMGSLMVGDGYLPLGELFKGVFEDKP